jgi:hypothetical protein
MSLAAVDSFRAHATLFAHPLNPWCSSTPNRPPYEPLVVLWRTTSARPSSPAQRPGRSPAAHPGGVTWAAALVMSAREVTSRSSRPGTREQPERRGRNKITGLSALQPA